MGRSQVKKFETWKKENLSALPSAHLGAPLLIRYTWRMIREFRKEYKDFWPTPTVEFCYMFAITEVGEAVDAYIRSTVPSFSRNSDRNRHLNEELADCAMMLLSAIGPEQIDQAIEQSGDHWSTFQVTNRRITDITLAVFEAVQEPFLYGDEITPWKTVGAVRTIMRKNDFHIVPEILARLERVYNKSVASKILIEDLQVAAAGSLE